jgi:subtilisin family serine protease
MTKTLAVLCAFVALGAGKAYAQDGTVRRVAEPVRDHYIVVLAANEDSLSVGVQSAAAHGGRLGHVYDNVLKGFSMHLTAAAAAALARDPRVLYVEEDGVVRASETQSSAPWNLDRTDQRNLPLNGLFNYPAPGPAVYVHVIDTGIRATHVDFTGRAFVVADFVDDDGDNNPADVGNDDGNPAQLDGADCNGHGTHVAGTVGGATYGVAKNATLLSYRVLGCTGSGTTAAVIAAIDRVTADGRRPAVANMSLGGSASSSLDTALRNSIASGVTYAVAAGNENVNASLVSPARVTEALTVAATNSSDTRASFSNYGTVVDLFAPGVSVRSAYYTSDSAAATLSGTSMASPLVAGVAALYLQAVGNQTPAQVQAALTNNATPSLVINPAGSPNRLVNIGFLLAPQPPPPAWATLTASPSAILAGQSSVLSFTTTTTNAHSIKINGVSPAYSCNATSCSGSLTVGPTVTTTYTLTAKTASGTPYPGISTAVTVNQQPPGPWTFTASPQTIQAGQNSALSFTTTSTDVANLKINGQSPTYSCSASNCTGSMTVTPSATTTYSLTATNGAGTPYPTLTVTVTVNAAPPPAWATFTATPSTIQAGQSSVLSFTTTTTNAHSIRINGVAPAYSCNASSCSGSLTVKPATTTTYTMTAKTAAGVAYPALTTTVTVGP